MLNIEEMLKLENKKITELKSEKNNIQKKNNKKIPLTYFQGFFVFFVSVCFFFLFYSFTQYFFIFKPSPAFLSFLGEGRQLLLGCFFKIVTVSPFFASFFFKHKESKHNLIQMVFENVKHIFIFFISTLFISALVSLPIFFFYFLLIIDLVDISNAKIIFHSSMILIFILYCFIYFNDYSKKYIKNKKEQNDFITKTMVKNKNKILEIKKEILKHEKNVLDSINSFEELSLLEYLIRHEKLKELEKIEYKIEKKLIENHNYKDIKEYKKEKILKDIKIKNISIHNE